MRGTQFFRTGTRNIAEKAFREFITLIIAGLAAARAFVSTRRKLRNIEIASGEPLEKSTVIDALAVRRARKPSMPKITDDDVFDMDPDEYARYLAKREGRP